MGDSAPEGVDAQVLADLLAVEQGCVLLGQAGARAEFWEAYTLLKTSREDVRAELDRLSRLRLEGQPAKVDPLLAEKLRGIRSELGPIAYALRRYLTRAAPELDSLRADLALVLFMGSAKGRAAADRWTAAPDASLAEATLRMKVMGRLVDAYRGALLEARRAGPATAAPASTGESRPSGATVRLRPQLVKDLHRAAEGRLLLKDLEPGVGWELLLLMITDAESTRRSLTELEQLQKSGKPGEFAGAAYNVRQRLQHVRAQNGDLVRSLGTYLKTLYGTWAGESDDLALVLLITEEEGRHRARQWLEDPELCRGEAMAAMNGMRSRARLHLEAAAQPAA